MSYCTKINSIEKLNLERFVDKICEEYRKKDYVHAVNLSQKGLISASKSDNILWVQMFDGLYKEMISSYNESFDTKSEVINTNMDILIKSHQEIKINFTQ